MKWRLLVQQLLALHSGIVFVVCDRFVGVGSVQTADDKVAVRVEEERDDTPGRLTQGCSSLRSRHTMQLDSAANQIISHTRRSLKIFPQRLKISNYEFPTKKVCFGFLIF